MESCGEAALLPHLRAEDAHARRALAASGAEGVKGQLLASMRELLGEAEGGQAAGGGTGAANGGEAGSRRVAEGQGLPSVPPPERLGPYLYDVVCGPDGGLVSYIRCRAPPRPAATGATKPPSAAAASAAGAKGPGGDRRQRPGAKMHAAASASAAPPPPRWEAVLDRDMVAADAAAAAQLTGWKLGEGGGGGGERVVLDVQNGAVTEHVKWKGRRGEEAIDGFGTPAGAACVCQHRLVTTCTRYLLRLPNSETPACCCSPAPRVSAWFPRRQRGVHEAVPPPPPAGLHAAPAGWPGGRAPAAGHLRGAGAGHGHRCVWVGGGGHRHNCLAVGYAHAAGAGLGAGDMRLVGGHSRTLRRDDGLAAQPCLPACWGALV